MNTRSLPSSLAALGALLLAGALVVAPTGAAQADPAFQQPDPGSCHSYPISQLEAPTDDAPPVSCAGPHTALTVAVLYVAPGLSGAKAARRLLPECYTAMKQTLGGNQKRIVKTAYDLTLFRPNDAQLAQGARWARCDLVLRGGGRLEQLPTPLLSSGGKIPDSVQRCAKNRGLTLTVCSRPHAQRAGKVINGRGKAYPGKRSFLRKAPRCGRGGTLYFPGKVDWKGGLKASICLVPDRRG